MLTGPTVGGFDRVPIGVINHWSVEPTEVTFQIVIIQPYPAGTILAYIVKDVLVLFVGVDWRDSTVNRATIGYSFDPIQSAFASQITIIQKATPAQPPGEEENQNNYQVVDVQHHLLLNVVLRKFVKKVF